jgi:hypothetical protein
MFVASACFVDAFSHGTQGLLISTRSSVSTCVECIYGSEGTATDAKRWGHCTCVLFAPERIAGARHLCRHQGGDTLLRSDLWQWSSRIEVSVLTLFHRELSTRRSSSGARKRQTRQAFFSGVTPLGRIGRPEEMASAIYSSFRTRVAIGLGSIWWWMAASRFELRMIGPRALRNLREVRAMQQQTACSSWITVPAG